MRYSIKEKCRKAEEESSLEAEGPKQRRKEINTHGGTERAEREYGERKREKARERETCASRMRAPRFHLT